MSDERVCSRCHSKKPDYEFSPCKRAPDGLYSICKSCKAADSKAYKLAHPEWAREYSQEYSKGYRERNREKLLRGKSEYAKKYPERFRASAKKYKAAHPDKVKARHSKYGRENRDKLNAITNNYRANKAKAPGNGITAKQWGAIKGETGGRCVYCGRKTKLEMDHVVPIINGGAHDITNIVPACRSCNPSKSDDSLIMFLYRRQPGN